MRPRRGACWPCPAPSRSRTRAPPFNVDRLASTAGPAHRNPGPTPLRVHGRAGASGVTVRPREQPAPIRVVIAKPGLDGHDRGAKVVARALRDAGVEVVYTGLHQTPEQIVETAIQEDADAVGLSVLSGAHMTLFARLIELLARARLDDIVVFGGGIIPEADIPELERLGVAKVFTPGATTTDIVDWVRANLGTAAGLPEPADGPRA